jgi:hypothetical protein
MSSGVNGSAVVIDEFGSTLHGSLLGTSSPTIDELSNDTTIKIYSKKVFLTQSVSANSNNRFFLPAVFGDNKAFIFINDELYSLNVDYKVDGLNCTWLNPNKTITLNDDVQVFGPGNKYTANAISFDVVDLDTQFLNSDPAFSNKQTILLKAAPIDPLLKYPFDGTCIYAFRNGAAYYYSIDFDYDEGSKKIIWKANDISLGDKIFIFYYNKYPTAPFKLGDVLSRTILTATINNQSSFTILDKPMKNYLQSSQVLHNRKRRSYKTDYNLFGMSLYTIDGGNLKPEISNSDILDVSYFSDVFVISTLSLLQQLYDGSSANVEEIQVKYNITTVPIATNVLNAKSFLFFNGLLQINKHFDNIASISYPDWEYNQTDNKITIWSQHASPRPAPYAGPLVPIAGDKIEFVTFLDNFSKNNVRVEYYQRSSSNIIYSVTAQENIKGGKYLLFYNGECLFKDNGTSLSGNQVTVTAYSAPPSGIKDDIVLVYFTDEQYANLWYFDNITVNTSIAANNDITFGHPIANINETLLFYNGVKVPKDQIISGSDNTKIKLINTNILSNSVLLLIHT